MLRRYGLLVPIGLAFDWLLWRHPTMFGVVEALGAPVVAGAVLAVAVGARWLPALAVATLAAVVLAERAVDGDAGCGRTRSSPRSSPQSPTSGSLLVGMAASRTRPVPPTAARA